MTEHNLYNVHLLYMWISAAEKSHVTTQVFSNQVAQRRNNSKNKKGQHAMHNHAGGKIYICFPLSSSFQRVYFNFLGEKRGVTGSSCLTAERDVLFCPRR